MKYSRIIITLFAAALMSGTMFAQEATPKINERQVDQQKRIRQGVRSGELTRKEARHLEAGEAKIQHDKKMAKADGKVTKAERNKLRHEQNHESKAIYNKKHNRHHRY
jgi:hypothetical protein